MLTKALCALSIVLLTACTATQVDEAWTLPGYEPPAQKRILVVVLSSQQIVRDTVELEFVQKLEAEGIEAIASFHHLPETKVVNRATLTPIVQQQNANLVLVSSLRDVKKNKVYQPADTVGPADSLYRNIDTYYTYSSTGQHEAGEYVETLEYIVETNLYDVASEKLSWSVNTKTLEPASIKKGAKSVVDTVIKQAHKDGVL